MTDLRRRLRSTDLPGREDVTLRAAAGALSKVVFVGVFVVALSLSLSADIVAVAVLASVLVAQMLYVVLPVHRIRARARVLWTGEAGEAAYDEVNDRWD